MSSAYERWGDKPCKVCGNQLREVKSPLDDKWYPACHAAPKPTLIVYDESTRFGPKEWRKLLEAHKTQGACPGCENHTCANAACPRLPTIT